MKDNRAWIFIVAVAFLLVAVFVAQARIERNYRVTAAEHVTLIVDSIDYRSDLTRFYGKLVGRPHTSQRIDALSVKSGAKTYDAIDIDGIDFNRWFQWEDEGVIDIEIDFPVMPSISTGVVTITTPRGIDSCNLLRK